MNLPLASPPPEKQAPIIVADPAQELAAIEAELQRRTWQEKPDIWVEERLHEITWSKQKEILRAVQANRRILVKSCHAIGKSFISARIAAWWIDAFPPGSAFVVTSAPSGPQIKAILWREIGRAFMSGHLPGRVNQTEWFLPVKGKEELVAFGRKPDDYSPSAFQGIHAQRVLVIIDEANGVRGQLVEAAESLIANDESKILMIGNPDDPSGEFFENSKPGSGWHVISISAFDSPNFTGEPIPPSVSKQLIGKIYVEEKRRKWAPHWKWVDAQKRFCTLEEGVKCIPPKDVNPDTDPNVNPTWLSKITGVFPEKIAAGGLLPIAWIKAAQLRDLSKTAEEKGAVNELGSDIGGGGDESATCHRKGHVYRILRSYTEPDTMIQTGIIIDDLRMTGATCVKVDKIGIGWGVVNRGQEQNKPFIGINVGEGATEDNYASDERFLNLKVELWWNVRSLFESGLIDIDPLDDDLAAELLSIRYERLSTGKIKISPKRKDDKGKIIASPNRA